MNIVLWSMKYLKITAHVVEGTLLLRRKLQPGRVAPAAYCTVHWTEHCSSHCTTHWSAHKSMALLLKALPRHNLFFFFFSIDLLGITGCCMAVRCIAGGYMGGLFNEWLLYHRVLYHWVLYGCVLHTWGLYGIYVRNGCCITGFCMYRWCMARCLIAWCFIGGCCMTWFCMAGSCMGGCCMTGCCMAV